MKDGLLTVSSPDIDAGLPINGRYEKAAGRITYNADKASFRKGATAASLQNIKADLQWDGDQQQWQGPWQAANITVNGAGEDIPPLNAAGTINAVGDSLSIEGRLQSTDRTYQVDFAYHYYLDAAKPALLHINSASMPWKQGRLKLGAFKMPLDGIPRDLKLNVSVENISVGELLGTLTGQRVQATGVISGTVPVTLKANGDMLFHHGSLKTAKPGKIIMPPDAIPGDQQQIKLVREILADLNYNNLSITMDSDQQNDLGILMTVEGNNPAVYNGRAVKLNVNLTGDLLDFIRQNVMLLTKPEALWEQDHVKSPPP